MGRHASRSSFPVASNLKPDSDIHSAAVRSAAAEEFPSRLMRAERCVLRAGVLGISASNMLGYHSFWVPILNEFSRNELTNERHRTCKLRCG